jgi:hypothetical protein
LLHELQTLNNIPHKNLIDCVWIEYTSSAKVDDDIKTVIEVGEMIEGKVEVIETIEA